MAESEYFRAPAQDRRNAPGVACNPLDAALPRDDAVMETMRATLESLPSTAIAGYARSSRTLRQTCSAPRTRPKFAAIGATERVRR
jgi:hypothetical protein